MTRSLHFHKSGGSAREILGKSLLHQGQRYHDVLSLVWNKIIQGQAYPIVYWYICSTLKKIRNPALPVSCIHRCSFQTFWSSGKIQFSCRSTRFHIYHNVFNIGKVILHQVQPEIQTELLKLFSQTWLRNKVLTKILSDLLIVSETHILTVKSRGLQCLQLY